VKTLNSTPTQGPDVVSSVEKMNDIACNLVQDAINEIKNEIEPRFMRPYLICQIGQHRIRALYDTGADVSCINAVQFEAIKTSDDIM
jgi:hypothetical protein